MGKSETSPYTQWVEIIDIHLIRTEMKMEETVTDQESLWNT